MPDDRIEKCRPGTALTRAHILEVAAQIVASSNAGALTMRAVSERSGLSRSTVHRHFPTRRDLVGALQQTGGSIRRRAGEALDEAETGPGTRSTGSRRLIAAARETFSEKGFSETTMKEISERAGLTPAMVYRHFGSKETLFIEATLRPLVEFITDYADRYVEFTIGSRSFVAAAEAFCGSLYDVLFEERELLFVIAAAVRFGNVSADAFVPLEEAFDKVFRQMRRLFDHEAEARQLRPSDRELGVRMIFAVVLSFALHGDWLLATGSYSRERVMHEMGRLLVRGVVGGDEAVVQAF